jgi:hypothetical protein
MSSLCYFDKRLTFMRDHSARTGTITNNSCQRKLHWQSLLFDKGLTFMRDHSVRQAQLPNITRVSVDHSRQ